MNQERPEEPPDRDTIYTLASRALTGYANQTPVADADTHLTAVLSELSSITAGNPPANTTKFVHACEVAYRTTPVHASDLITFASKLEKICKNPNNTSKAELESAAKFFYNL